MLVVRTDVVLFWFIMFFAVSHVYNESNIMNMHCKIAVEAKKHMQPGKPFSYYIPMSGFYPVKITLFYNYFIFIIIDWVAVMLKGF